MNAIIITVLIKGLFFAKFKYYSYNSKKRIICAFNSTLDQFKSDFQMIVA